MKKQDKNNKDVFLTDCMTLPGMSTSLPVLTLIGNREMYIENIKTIMEYNDTCVKILTKKRDCICRGRTPGYRLS